MGEAQGVAQEPEGTPLPPLPPDFTAHWSVFTPLEEKVVRLLRARAGIADPWMTAAELAAATGEAVGSTFRVYLARLVSLHVLVSRKPDGYRLSLSPDDRDSAD